MEEMGEFSSTLFLQGEPIRNLQSPLTQPDIPIQDFSIDARFATLLSGRSTNFQEHLHSSMIPQLANNYEQLDGSSCKWDFNGFDPIANMNLDNRYRESAINFNNELSLSLATSRPSIPYHRSVQFPALGSGSRYMTVIQEILTRVASYSLENFDPVSYVAQVDGSNAFGWNGQEGGYNMVPMVRARRKDLLLALLQAVDDQYNQCSDDIHTVISAFHAATELDPKIHSKFALQTMSMLYKNLRERISNCILSMGDDSIDQSSRAGRDLERRWALQQQLKKKEHLQHHHLWRVQRGLPEKSVSVLRTWMFDNFLHPYPKDAEKQLLSLKSGLSRSQVSNWFINARVRLWKPMIEEMYAEMNRRKGIAISREVDEGSCCLNHTHHKNCITF